MRYIIIFFFFYTPFVSGQDIIGTVKTAYDSVAIIGANVILKKLGKQEKRATGKITDITGTTTDVDGNFKMENISQGTYKLEVFYLGYKSFTSEAFVLNKEKVDFGIIKLKEENSLAVMYSLSLGDDYQIMYCIDGEGDIPLILDHHPAFDNFSMLGNTLRVYKGSSELAGTFDDPSRVLYRTPGISMANDQANSIVYRGLSADNIKWSVEGAEIVNPNHLSNAGTLSDQSSASAGGVLAIPLNVISTFSFNGQPFASNLVNSVSGVSNFRFNFPTDNFVKFGLLGMEASYENTKGLNFRLHGRYSTVGLLSDLGVDFDGESIKFQDLFFQVNLSEHLKFTNILGSSSNFHAPLDSTELAMTIKDLNEIDYNSRLNIHGLSYSKNNTEHHLYFSTKKDVRKIKPFPDYNESQSLNRQTKLSYRGKQKFNDFDLQLLATYQDYELSYPSSNFNNSFFEIQPSVNHTVELEIFDQVTFLKTGLSAFYDTFNNEFSFEPSFSVQMSKSATSVFELSTSYVTQMQDPYLYGIRDEFGNANNLDLNRSRTWSNSLTYKNNADYNILARVFYQSLFNLPDMVGINPVVNGVPFGILGNFTQEGKGSSYGLELMVDKDYNGFYWNVNTTLFKTKAGSLNASNNFGFTNNVSLTKTFTFKNNKVLKINTASHFRGGAYVNNILDAPYFQAQLSNYFRVDMRILYTWKKSSLILDIQNLTNRLNDAYYYYEALTDDIVLEKQLGTIPILSYKRTF